MIKLNVCIMSLLLASSMAFAAPDISYEGTTTHTIPRTTSKQHLLKAPSLKSVTLLKVKLSDNAKKVIQNNAAHATVLKTNSSHLPSFVQLGMNGVPVLDQGMHGTCATFALLAAIDAAKGEGDYYSELCSLNFGKYLADHGYSFSGWDGHSPSRLLARIDEFGLVSKAVEQEGLCGGLTEYPVLAEDTSDAMSLDDFYAKSESWESTGIDEWSNYYNFMQFMYKDIPMTQILEKTKKSLYYGNRVVLGVFVPMMDNLGLEGKYHAQNDSWVLSPVVEQQVKLMSLIGVFNWGGHAMVITGYDDNAVAVDEEGHSHQGLFTLRNSWGSDVGDHGNFYMSYDYFMALTNELDELVKINL